MSKNLPPYSPFLPDLASKISEWMPDLEGRVIPVSEADITRENLPTLPLCMLSLIRGAAEIYAWKSPSGRVSLVDDFIIEFWLKPVRYDDSKGQQTPFWAFYDYEVFRNDLLTQISRYNGPCGQRIEYVTLDIETTEYAVILSFRFKAHFEWQPDEEKETLDGQPVKVTFKLCQPKTIYCGPCSEPKECDPCL